MRLFLSRLNQCDTVTGCICIRYTLYRVYLYPVYTLQGVFVSGIHNRVYLYPVYTIQCVSVSSIHYRVYQYLVYTTGCICIRYIYYRMYLYPVYTIQAVSHDQFTALQLVEVLVT